VQATKTSPPVKKTRKISEREKWIGLFFIMPWIIGFSVFQLYPFIMTLWYSFTDHSMFNQPSFIGLENYRMLFESAQFRSTMIVTGRYALMSVPGKLIFALAVAMLLNSKVAGIGIYRSLYYLPSILGSSVAVSVLWRVMFMRDGIVNQFIGNFGLGPINWLTSPDIALTTISMLQVWQFGSSMVIFLAALKQIPTELYESASVDGAGPIRKFFSITVPQISSVIFFNLIMQTVQVLQDFTAAAVITNGGPMRSTYLIGLKLYDDAFRSMRIGYASAQSWILFLVILAITALVFKSSGRWVYYADEGERK